ncbi:MAG: DEAD/DEAH box helicase [Ferrovum sp.]|nr:DEAD/DEAH box helicase [Ferrovum sp.]
MTQSVRFEDLTLDPRIVSAVTEAGYIHPTPVQAQAIPALLEGRDLLVSSRTGSGKTAAFMLPALHKLLQNPRVGRSPRLLVLSPTRELANQITEAAKKYGKNVKSIQTVSVLGGMSYPVQNKMLAKPYDILVATPGRLIDQLNQGRIDLSKIEMLVLDEADRMLDMGFVDDVTLIASKTPQNRQTLLFSATFDKEIVRLANALLKNPLRIEATDLKASHDLIDQRLHYVDDLSHKNRILAHLLSDTELNQAIIFTATKRDADSLASDLSGLGHSAAALHGDMHQGARTRTLDRLRRGQLRVLVATDVASRGIDVPGISHVINYDLPKQAEDYVHRIGRTGRAGQKGIAISLASGRDYLHLQKIQKFTGSSISVHTIDGFEPKRPFKPTAPAKNARTGFGGGNNTKRPFAGNKGNSKFEERSPSKGPGFYDGKKAAPRSSNHNPAKRVPFSF